MPRNLQITLVILAVAVVVGLLSLRSLQNRIERLAQTPSTEAQARRDLLKPPISTPSDVVVQTKLFWAVGSDKIAPTEVALALSADPVKRGRQVIDALILRAPEPDARTLPSEAILMGFYILADGTAVADFSDTLTSGMPSGILSEELAVDSIARTLESNVSGLRRLKILIHGQEADTLAGHVDLTGFFDLNSSLSALARARTAPDVAPPQNPRQAVPPAAAASNPAQVRSR